MTRIMNHSKWASDQSQIKLLIALDNPAPAPAPCPCPDQVLAVSPGRAELTLPPESWGRM